MADPGTRVLAGRYEVGELIGRGGMAEVHVGRDTRLGRTVAIKVLRSDLARDPSFQARFRREAQSAASLNHPAIVSVYDTGEDTVTEAGGGQQPVPFIVMEYVEGHTVRDLLRDGAALPIDEAVEITVGVLSALEYSHRAGIVHRDIKPANVMLTPTGDVKVMDFGIARAMADAAGTMTQTQAVVGTAQYLSPEQARGEVVDTRSDLYSTGCLLYELLTGRPPFVGDSAVAVAYQHVSEEAQPPSTLAPDVPEALDRIVMKALTKDKEQRYGTAQAFRGDLEAAAADGVISAPALGAKTTVLGAAGAGGPATQVFGGASSRPPAVEPDAEAAEDDEPPRSRALLWILVVVALIAAAGITWLLLNRDAPAEEEPTPTVETVEVPPLEGLDEDQITAELQAVQLTPEFTTEASDDVDEGLFVSSDPAPGEPVELAESGPTTVDVVLSAGPDAVTVPDIVGLSREEARQQLTAEGFEGDFEFTQENLAGVGPDEVASSDPAPGDSLQRDGSIAIVVGSGNVEVPDFRGQLLTDVQDQLDDLDIQVNTNTVPGVEPEGTIIDQDRNGLIPVDSSIRLTISDGTVTPEPTDEATTEDPPDEPTDEPTEDPTDDGDNQGQGQGPGQGPGQGQGNGPGTGPGSGGPGNGNGSGPGTGSGNG